MKRILIAGGSGFIGEHLRRLLVSKYYEVYILSTQRNLVNSTHVIYWNPYDKVIDIGDNKEFDTIINLAGANIGQKFWTKKRKEELYKSRIESTFFLKSLIQQGRLISDYFIQTSAIGIYGDRGNEKLVEDSFPGKGFLAELTLKWEESIKELSIPYSILRLGIVFSPHQGAFPKLIMGLKFKFLVIFGKGSQYISWIDIDDLCHLFSFAIDNRIKGVYNAVSPQPVEYIYLLKRYNNKYGSVSIPFIIPAFIVRFFMRDFSELFLNSQRVSSKKIEKLGFKFETLNFKYFLEKYRKKIKD